MKYLFPALLFLSFNAHATSYDCRKASNYVERTICQDIILSNLDEAMAYNYKIMLSANNISQTSKKLLRSQQREWLKKRNQCRSRDCIERQYRYRIESICQYPVLWGSPPSCIREEEIFR